MGTPRFLAADKRSKRNQLAGTFIESMASPGQRKWTACSSTEEYDSRLKEKCVRERYRALVAVVPPALADLQRILSEYVDFMPVYRLEDVRDRRPHIPFVCLRILDFALPKISIDAIRIAISSLGATAFIDGPAMAQQYGVDEMDARFRGAVLSHLKGREASGTGS
jgi:hypothetical protein